MLHWLLVFLGFGPVQRAIAARLRASIHEAEADLVRRKQNLDDGLRADIEALEARHRLNIGTALDNVVSGVMKKGIV